MKYYCRALLVIEADDPIEAAEEYMQELKGEEVPLEELVYRIEDEHDNMTYVFHGKAYTLHQLQEEILPPDEVERIRAAQAAATGG